MKIILFALIMFISRAASAETLSGVAKSVNGKMLYREVHDIEPGPAGSARSVRTTYFDPSGKKIALLASDFSRDPHLPDTKLEDFRFQRVYEGRLISDNSTGPRTYQIIQSDSGKQVKVSNLKVEGVTIAVQGFDNFIVGQLLAKDVALAKVLFLVLPRHDFFHFEIIKTELSSPNEIQYRVRASNPLIRIFVKEIKVSYSRATRQLLRYQGLSNLPSENDESQVVDIEYGSKI
jgi:hypothetical protein